MSSTTDAARQWFIVGRWQEFAGEGRANLLRVVALLVFYGVQLYQYSFVEVGSAPSIAFHRQATLIAVAWSLAALAVLVCLQRRIFPAALKYVSTTADVLLLTLLAHAAGGPQTPPVQIYYLIILLAALRFSVELIWFTTGATMFGYLALVGAQDQRWFDAEHATPLTAQLLTLAGLTLAGLIAGQVVRRTKHMAQDYAARTSAAQGAASTHA